MHYDNNIAKPASPSDQGSKPNILNTDLYCFLTEEYSTGRDNLKVARELVQAGVKIIQYREKDKKQRVKYQECQEIRKITAPAGVTFIINDDIEIARLVGADGVHLGQDDLPVEQARKLVGDSMIIGISTHSPQQAQEAIAGGADYIGVGPIFKTFTKKDVCNPVGLDYLRWAVNHVNIPFVTIGGIKKHNIVEVKRSGAGCIGIVTEILGSRNITREVQALRELIRQARTVV
jgi:thiamine-phosphate pyrophosphorylase